MNHIVIKPNHSNQRFKKISTAKKSTEKHTRREDHKIKLKITKTEKWQKEKISEEVLALEKFIM